MARSNQLYLQVGANVDNLSTQMKVARSAVLNWGNETTDVVELVRKEFDNLGANGLAASNAQIEAGFKKTIATIKANAQELASAGSAAKAIQLLDAQSSEEAAVAKRAQAAALTEVARAASTATLATEADTLKSRELAVGAETAAQSLLQEARALEDNARVLRGVQGAMAGTTGANVALGNASNRNTASAGQQRLAFQQLGFQINDVATGFASGQKPMQIFAQQGGQVIQALSLMTNSTKGFLGFLGGPWGAVLTAATIVFVPFVAQLLEGNNALDDAIDKLKKDAEAADINRQAKERFAKTEEGVAAAIRESTEATLKSLDAGLSAAELANKAAEANLAEELSIRRKTQARLQDAREAFRIAQIRSNGPGQRGELGTLAAGSAAGEVAALETKLAENQRLIEQAERKVNDTRVSLAVELAARLVDPIEKIKKQYKDEAAAAEKAAREAALRGEKIDADALAKKIAKIKAAGVAAEKTEQKRQADARGSTSANRQIGREIDVTQATRIVEGIGGRVTSGTRSRAEQERIYADKLAGRHDGPVAVPGTSAHERGGAIDVAFGPGITIASIKKAFADQGVALRKILAEPAQRVFHVEFGKAGPSADTIAKRQQAEADKREADAKAYGDLLSRAQERAVNLTRSRADDIAVAAALDVQAIELERQRLDAAAQLGADQRRWSQAQADAVKLLNKQNADAEANAIKMKAAFELTERQYGRDRDAARRQEALLHLQDDLATTAAQRKEIALRLLALEEQEARKAAIRLTFSRDPAERERGAAELRAISEQAPLRRAQVDRQYENPIERFRRKFDDPKTQVQEAVAQKLQDVDDAISGAVTNALGIKDPFLARLIQIFLEQNIFKPIFDSFSKIGSSKGLVAGDGIGDFLSKVLGSIFGGGRATGGGVDGSKFYLVGERGPELFAPGMSGSIVPNHLAFPTSLPRIPNAGSLAAGGQGREIVYVQVDKSALFDVHVQRAAGPVAMRGALAGSQLAQNEIAEQRYQEIPR